LPRRNLSRSRRDLVATSNINGPEGRSFSSDINSAPHLGFSP